MQIVMTAIREYVQPLDCDVEDCKDQYHPHCPDIYPATWGEYMDPDTMAGRAGWYTDPPDDETAPTDDEPVKVTFNNTFDAAEYMCDWHGAIWDFGVESEYSTDDYRTGRESMDRLFVDTDDLTPARLQLLMAFFDNALRIRKDNYGY